MAERIDHEIARQILRGGIEVGARLPGVRVLAERFGVNPSTIQRVIARLEAKRLVTARPGSGVRVNDPRRVGDLSLIPEWIAALEDRPTEAARLAGELLFTRRMLATAQIVRHRHALLGHTSALEQAAGQIDSSDPAAARTRELDMWRSLSQDAGIGTIGVLNTLERALEELPLLAEAMWAKPRQNANRLRALLEAVDGPEQGCAERVEAVLARLDHDVVARFEELLVAASAGR